MLSSFDADLTSVVVSRRRVVANCRFVYRSEATHAIANSITPGAIGFEGTAGEAQ